MLPFPDFNALSNADIPRSQTRLLRRLNTFQQQEMAHQIARFQGNRFTSRLVQAYREHRPSPLAAAEGMQGHVQREIASSELSAFGTPQQTQFMRRVYDLQIVLANRIRGFVGDVPAEELGVVEGSVSLRTAAAAACRNLLAAARAALAADQESEDALAVQAHSVGVVSGYRSATSQLGSWRDNFPNYYEQTQEQRASQTGGEHGDAAARYLARYISGRLAAPGHSLHNNGLAVDFSTHQGRNHLAASTAQVGLWQRSWFYRWLTAHASEYNFALNPSINEPWHWEYHAPSEGESAAAE